MCYKLILKLLLGIIAIPAILSAQPKITSFAPLSGAVGETIIISGSNFNIIPANNIVYFGGAKALVTKSSSTSLNVIVPTGAMYRPVSVTTNGLTAYSKQSFHVIYNGGVITSESFTRKRETHDYYESQQTAVLSDLDLDGRTDIIEANYPTDEIFVFRNSTLNGLLSFAPVQTFSSADFPRFVTAADIDGDGKQDIIWTDAWSSSIQVMRNTSVPGSISFTTPDLFFTGRSPWHVAVGDIDGDGKPDLAVANESEKFISILKNRSTVGNISFATQIIPAARDYNSFALIRDMDGDDKPDILVANHYDSTFSVFRNLSTPGNISLDVRADFSTGAKTAFIAMGDIDGDSTADLVISRGYYGAGFSGIGNSNIISVLKNKSAPGKFIFGKPVNFKASQYPYNIELNDLDGDGKVDIATANGQDSLVILRNTSTVDSFSFEPKFKYNLDYAYDPEFIEAGDLDGDGKPDLTVVSEYYQSMTVMINQNGSVFNLCVNGSGTLSAGLTGSSYQWQVNIGSGYINITNNAHYSGDTTAALYLKNVPTRFSGYKYRCSVGNAKSKEFTLNFLNQWIGAADHNWSNAANWSCNSVPDKNTNVVIDSGGVIVNKSTTVRTLNIKPGAKVTISNGVVLTVTN